MYKNKKITRDYQILFTIECGIELTGHDVTLFRASSTHVRPLNSVRVTVEDGQLYAYGLLGETKHRLLAHKSEIRKLSKELDTAGRTLVVVQVHRCNNLIKMDVAAVKGLSKVDKRQKLRKEQADRDARAALSSA